MVAADEREGGEVDEDKVVVAAMAEGKETVGEKDEGAEKEHSEQMEEIADAEGGNHTVAAAEHDSVAAAEKM